MERRNQIYEEDLFNEEPDYVKKPVQKGQYQYEEVGNRFEQNDEGNITKYRYNELIELVQARGKLH